PVTRSCRSRSARVSLSSLRSALHPAWRWPSRASSTRPWSASSRPGASTSIRRRSAFPQPDPVIAALATKPAVRAALIGAYILLVEWTRSLASREPGAATAAIVLGGAALLLTVVGTPPARLGLGTSRLGLRVLGGFALAAVLLLPAAVRADSAPILPASLAFAAITVSVVQELAFRGALYAALEEAGGAPLAIIGS